MKVILSISGGGIKGLIPAMVLEEIEKRLRGYKISDCCNLIAGNSTGGIIACLLTMPNIHDKPKYSAGQIVNMYKHFGKYVFRRSIFRTIGSLNGLIANKYSHKNLEKLIKEYFQIASLSDTTTDILVPTYQISDSPYPYFFKSAYAKDYQKNVKNPYLWQCARSTSAASSFFSPYKFNKEFTFIDGGLFANNPSMCAYAEGKRMWGEKEQIFLISLGTGENLKGYRYQKIKKWGIFQWAIPYFQQTAVSADSTVDYMLRTFTEGASDRYFRLQPHLDEKSLKMDNVSSENIIKLETAARQLIEKNMGTIDEICAIFKKNIGNRLSF